MADFRSKIREIYSLECLSRKETLIHHLHPLAKFSGALVFVVAVISCGRYEPGRLIPFFFYPVILLSLSETPYGLMFRRLAVALPFCLLAGISNVFFEKTQAVLLAGLSLSYGWLSFFVILCKALLSVSAILILVATTPVCRLSRALRSMGIPQIFVSVLEMVYRYAGLLIEEACTMQLAYNLRGTGKKGVDIRHGGSFAGQLFLRSADRAERVWAAMKLRGYGAKTLARPRLGFGRRDMIYFILVCAFCLVFRFWDLTGAVGTLLGGK
ncbi:MAG: cobalt ECF transporter T component CbiQ [Fusobacteriaceae bacterium]|jgi:cobalt/nickel transport system permease protein|nr:cobalt ECF transporter T component CbiQ [Fusobacteriaceae bacterium]